MLARLGALVTSAWRWWLLPLLAAVPLFALTWSPRVGLGDAPESVAGIVSLGVLHAPGYPTYVLVGWVVTHVLFFLEPTAAVQLLSVGCALGTVAVTAVMAARLGAPRWAAAFGAMVLASGTSFWFYAGFAKHYALSALLLALVLLGALRWQQDGRRSGLVLAAVAGGLLVGAGWPSAALALPAVLAAVALRRPWPRVGDLLAVIALAVGTAALLYGYVLVRGPQDPGMNWGYVTSWDRLLRLLTLEDFGYGVDAIGTSADARVGSKAVTRAPSGFTAYAQVAARESGVLALALGAVGGVALLVHRFRLALVTGVLLVTALAAAILTTNPRAAEGFETTLVQGGFLVPLFLVVALWAALGLDAVARLTARGVRGRAPQVRVAVVAAVAATALVPAVVVHAPHADHGHAPFAEQFAANVLDPLPADSVVFLWGAERAFPLRYAQVVHGRRPDVLVVAAEGLNAAWVREQVEQRSDVQLPRPRGTAAEGAVDVARVLASRRPVYLDTGTVREVGSLVGYRPYGLVAELDLAAVGLQEPDLGTAERLVAAWRTKGLHSHTARSFPNDFVNRAYADAHVELAEAYRVVGDGDATRRHLEAALRLRPGFGRATEALTTVAPMPEPRQ